MKNLTIILGQSAPMTDELMQRFNFIIAPFKLEWPDGENLTGDMFVKMREARRLGIKTTPKTSQPSMGLYKKAFEEGLSKTQFVLAIAISSAISGTYNSAMQAKKMFSEEEQKRIFVLDTYCADGGETLLGIQAAEMDEQGMTPEEIMQKLEALKINTKLFGMLEGPYWLEAGGRISHPVSVLMEQMQKLGMRPILSIIDGLVKQVNLKMKAKKPATELFKQLDNTFKKQLPPDKSAVLGIFNHKNLIQHTKLEEILF